MAAFSNYQQQYYPAVPFVTDSFLEPDTISNNMCCFSTDHDGTGFSSYFPDSHQQIPLHDDHQIHESNTTGPPLHKSYAAADATTAMAVELGTSDGAHPVEKKRKNMDSNSMVGKEGRDGKCSGSILRSTHGEERRRRFSKKQKKVAPVEVPSGYVHVRARRGHATDSHSLAERVRRQKISVRMKLLQSLVPGCDKMTGKALILDEIIRYVRTLQSQVQFLAAKVSSFTPMLNDFKLMDFNTNYPLPQEQLPPVMESSSTRLLNHQEQSSNVTFQDNCNLLWGIDDSRIQEFENQYGLHNLHSF